MEEVVTEFVCRLLDARRLIAAVHQRAADSPVVAEFHDRTHRLYEDLLSSALADRCPDEADRRLATEAIVATAEGLIMHGATKAQVRRTIPYLLARLTTSPPAAS